MASSGLDPSQSAFCSASVLPDPPRQSFFPPSLYCVNSLSAVLKRSGFSQEVLKIIALSFGSHVVML